MDEIEITKVCTGWGQGKLILDTSKKFYKDQSENILNFFGPPYVSPKSHWSNLGLVHIPFLYTLKIKKWK